MRGDPKITGIIFLKWFIRFYTYNDVTCNTRLCQYTSTVLLLMT